jgi:hypothetical protein
VDISLLQQLATNGFSEVRPADLGRVAKACSVQCRETGVGKFCVLSDTFSALYEFWMEHDNYNGIPSSLAQALERPIMNRLGAVLEESGLAEGAAKAAALEDDIYRLVQQQQFWSTRNV